MSVIDFYLSFFLVFVLVGSSCWTGNFKTTIIIIAVIFVAPYLTDMGEHTALYKINNNVYINK